MSDKVERFRKFRPRSRDTSIGFKVNGEEKFLKFFNGYARSLKETLFEILGLGIAKEMEIFRVPKDVEAVKLIQEIIEIEGYDYDLGLEVGAYGILMEYIRGLKRMTFDRNGRGRPYIREEGIEYPVIEDDDLLQRINAYRVFSYFVHNSDFKNNLFLRDYDLVPVDYESARFQHEDIGMHKFGINKDRCSPKHNPYVSIILDRIEVVDESFITELILNEPILYRHRDQLLGPHAKFMSIPNFADGFEYRKQLLHDRLVKN